jgi:hypothetical protein
VTNRIELCSVIRPRPRDRPAMPGQARAKLGTSFRPADTQLSGTWRVFASVISALGPTGRATGFEPGFRLHAGYLAHDDRRRRRCAWHAFAALASLPSRTLGHCLFPCPCLFLWMTLGIVFSLFSPRDGVRSNHRPHARPSPFPRYTTAL